jgi:hypothetical protein
MIKMMLAGLMTQIRVSFLSSQYLHFSYTFVYAANEYQGRWDSLCELADNTFYKVGFEVLTAVSMKIALSTSTSETLVNFYQTTRCYNPEDSNLHIL